MRKGLFWLLLVGVLAGSRGLAWGQTAVSGLLLTEIYYDTPGEDAAEEWVEIANLGSTAVDLSGVKLSDAASLGGREGTVRFPVGAEAAPGQVMVVAQTAVGFRALFGQNPDYEITDSDPNVPDMRRYLIWSTGDFALSNSGDEVLLLDAQDQRIDRVGYGESTAVFTPSVAGVLRGQSIARVPANCDTDTAADWQPQPVPNPGVITFEGECTAPVNPAEAEPLPPIGLIQGAGDVSPWLDQEVSFRGIVTGFYEDRNTAGVTYYTLFVQDLPGYEDGDPATSDGMAIFLGRQRPSFTLGDQVRVTGQVTEFFGFTELDDSGLQIVREATDVPLPDPIFIDPPAEAEALTAYFEPLESMRVAVAGEARVVGPTFSGCGFAIVTESVTAPRIFRRQLADPIGEVLPILHTSDVDCTGFPVVQVGDKVRGLVGPLIYNFDQYKLVQQDGAALVVTAVAHPTLPTPPVLAPDEFSIASFNLENYFDTVDDTGDDAEPKPTAVELEVKQVKLASALVQVLGCPTVAGVQEVENAGLLEVLAARVRPECGFVYTVVHRESADGRGIDVAFLVDSARVQVQVVQLRQGCTAVATGVADPTANCRAGQFPLFARPPLEMVALVDGQPFTFLVNHFKSKREGEAETAVWRMAQAEFVNGLVADMLAQNSQAAIIVLGDLNDYEMSPPMLALTGEGGTLTNVLRQVPEAERYSFVYGGVSQMIDGVLVSPVVLPLVVSVHIMHTNADFPDAWGADVSPERLPFKTTDHDLPLVVLKLPEGQASTAVSTPTWPPLATETVPPTLEPEAPSTGQGIAWSAVLGGAAGLLLLLAGLFFSRRKS